MKCEKRGYNSYREAQEILNMTRKRKTFGRFRGKKDKKPQRSYLCPDCGMWHLTSKAHYER